MKSGWFGKQREDVGVIFARASVVLACVQLSLLLLILGLSFSSHTVSSYLSILYFLGEIVCAVFAIPLAIAALRLETKGDAGRRALFVALGITAACGFFMVFPA